MSKRQKRTHVDFALFDHIRTIVVGQTEKTVGQICEPDLGHVLPGLDQDVSRVQMTLKQQSFVPKICSPGLPRLDELTIEEAFGIDELESHEYLLGDDLDLIGR